ncbi:hypothetical protein D3C87_2113850 [compost metagenome]
MTGMKVMESRKLPYFSWSLAVGLIAFEDGLAEGACFFEDPVVSAVKGCAVVEVGEKLSIYGYPYHLQL